ncbi:MAG: HD domain-containing protein [Polyangiaceae bacterium]|nr:HD domain-containing protein [Polyangiaceae bacterium]
MMNDAVLARLRDEARSRLEGAEPAHDFSHVERVVKNARTLADAEGADHDVVTTAALLHELFNYPKNHPESHRSGDVCAEEAAKLLRREGLPEAFVEAVASAIADHAFSKGATPSALEARILQDADRLDAIGAIGVARCLATCAAMKRPFYAPDDPFCTTREPEDKLWGIDHFYKKLLRIPEKLHTQKAREMAEERVQFLRTFLGQLEREIA